MLVAALNPTPRGDMPKGAEGQRIMERYLSRLSGPLIDRIDIHVEVPSLPYAKLRARPDGQSSETIRGQVQAARDFQARRQGAARAQSEADHGDPIRDRLAWKIRSLVPGSDRVRSGEAR